MTTPPRAKTARVGDPGESAGSFNGRSG